MSEPANASGGVVERRRAIRSSQNFVAGLTLLAVAAIALFATADLGEGRFYAVGPALLPRPVATLLAFALSIRTVGLAVAGPTVALISGAASPETRPRELLLFALLVTALSIGLF